MDVFTNQTTTIVETGGTTTSDTDFNVSSTTGFPITLATGQVFRIVDIDDSAAVPEIMVVTAVSGDDWTVTRGAEGTAPNAHAAGWTAQTVPTAGALNALASQMLSGATSPSDAVGVPGSFYLDTTNGNLYGPKTNTWTGAPVFKLATASSSLPSVAQTIKGTGTSVTFGSGVSGSNVVILAVGSQGALTNTVSGYGANWSRLIFSTTGTLTAEIWVGQNPTNGSTTGITITRNDGTTANLIAYELANTSGVAVATGQEFQTSSSLDVGETTATTVALGPNMAGMLYVGVASNTFTDTYTAASESAFSVLTGSLIAASDQVDATNKYHTWVGLVTNTSIDTDVTGPVDTTGGTFTTSALLNVA